VHEELVGFPECGQLLLQRLHRRRSGEVVVLGVVPLDRRVEQREVGWARPPGDVVVRRDCVDEIRSQRREPQRERAAHAEADDAELALGAVGVQRRRRAAQLPGRVVDVERHQHAAGLVGVRGASAIDVGSSATTLRRGAVAHS
jgi:hypothetical protein